MRFLMVDRIDGAPSRERIRGRKLAALSEDVFEHHFPERAIVPGNLILEACTQLAGWHTALLSDFDEWLVLSGVPRARWMSFAQPGDVLEIELVAGERRDLDEGASASPSAGSSAVATRAYQATVTVDGERRASIDLVGRVVALAALMDPEDARARFEQLGGMSLADDDGNHEPEGAPTP